jgi:hypothetical protein
VVADRRLGDAAEMPKTFRIELLDRDLYQLLDGLETRAEAWARTAEYLRSERMPGGEVFIIEDANDPEEAEQVVRHYREIIATIRTQIEAQR